MKLQKKWPKTITKVDPRPKNLLELILKQLVILDKIYFVRWHTIKFLFFKLDCKIVFTKKIWNTLIFYNLVEF